MNQKKNTTQETEISKNNYYSNAMSWAYMSVSQYKDFERCEAAALAKLKEEWKPPMNKEALLVGNYVHSYFEDEQAHEEFKEENKEFIFSKRKPYGILKAYQVAEDMIHRIKDEPFFNYLWQGEAEKIVTGELYGTSWKGRIDLLNVEKGYFVDLKTTMDLHKRFYSKKYGTYVSFVEEYGYNLQLAVYEKLLEIEYGKPFKGFVYAVTKQNPPDIAAVNPDDFKKQFELDLLKENIERVNSIKNGQTKPSYCGNCEYCRGVKKLDNFINTDELIR